MIKTLGISNYLNNITTAGLFVHSIHGGVNAANKRFDHIVSERETRMQTLLTLYFLTFTAKVINDVQVTYHAVPLVQIANGGVIIGARYYGRKHARTTLL